MIIIIYYQLVIIIIIITVYKTMKHHRSHFIVSPGKKRMTRHDTDPGHASAKYQEMRTVLELLQRCQRLTAEKMFGSPQIDTNPYKSH